MYKNIFVAYSPVQLLYSISLSCQDSLILVPKDIASNTLINLHHNLSIRYISIPSFDSSVTSKILSFVFLLLFSPRLKCNALYISSASHYFVQLIRQGIRYKYCYYVDEGNTVLSLIRHLGQPRLSNSSPVMRFFFNFFKLQLGANPVDYNFDGYYVAHHQLFSKITNKNPVLSLPPLSSLKLLYKRFPHAHSSNIVILASSPITENRWSEYHMQEIDILSNFLSSYIGLNTKSLIIIKPHYREQLSKYDSLTANFPECVIIEPLYPIQLILAEFPPAANVSIVGFHSSALFSSDSIKHIISLSNHIKTPIGCALYKGIKQFAPYFPSLKFVDSLH